MSVEDGALKDCNVRQAWSTLLSVLRAVRFAERPLVELAFAGGGDDFCTSEAGLTGVSS
jgi:hypothetical protein